MKRWHLLSAVSVILTLFMVVLWLLIPGFPLLIFFLLPPILLCGSRTSEKEHRAEHQTSQAEVRESQRIECRFCRKKVNLEPDETYCPQCGERISE